MVPFIVVASVAEHECAVTEAVAFAAEIEVNDVINCGICSLNCLCSEMF